MFPSAGNGTVGRGEYERGIHVGNVNDGVNKDRVSGIDSWRAIKKKKSNTGGKGTETKGACESKEDIIVLKEEDLSASESAKFMTLVECDTSGEIMGFLTGVAEEEKQGGEEKKKNKTRSWSEILSEVAKTKTLPSGIQWESEEMVDLLFDHFTRMTPREVKRAMKKKEWKRVIRKYRHLFRTEIGSMKCAPYKFRMKHDKPKRHRAYGLSPQKKGAIEKLIGALLKSEVIVRMNSDWASLVVIIEKGDGRFRLCVDYRYLNSLMIPEPTVYPRVQEISECAGGANLFSVIDGKDFFFQQKLHRECWRFTAFVCHSGIFCFMRCPQGLTNSPAAAILPIIAALTGLLYLICIVWSDDVLIWATEKDEVSSDVMCVNFGSVLERLDKLGVTLGWIKVWVCLKQCEFVSHVISAGKMTPAPKLMKAIDVIPVPRSVVEVQKFVGMMQYYACCIVHLAYFRAKLTELTCKDVVFENVWSSEHTHAFECIKRLLKRSMLYLIDWARPMTLVADASGVSVAGVLLQLVDGVWRPIKFMSRSLSKYEQTQENAERELRAGLDCMRKCHTIIDMHPFCWCTDHSNLLYIYKCALSNPRIARLAMYLSQWPYKISPMKGVHILMKMADYFSRAKLEMVDTTYKKTPYEDGNIQRLLHEATSLSVIKDYDGDIQQLEFSQGQVQIRRDGYIDIQAQATKTTVSVMAEATGMGHSAQLAQMVMPVIVPETGSLRGMRAIAITPALGSMLAELREQGVEIPTVIEFDSKYRKLYQQVVGPQVQVYDDVEAYVTALQEGFVSTVQIDMVVFTPRKRIPP